MNLATRKVRDSEAVFRQTVGFLEAWVSIVGNIALFLVKFAIGKLIGSISLIADSVHTLSDVLTSVVVLAGFKIGGREPDKEHPFGHGRIESIATLIIAILLILVGVEFLRQSIERLRQPRMVAGTILVVLIMLLSGVLKELMASFSIWLGRRIDSSTLIADAWHHRSDAIASVLVAVAIVGAIFHVYWLDGLFGLLVSLLIIYTGGELGWQAANYLIGTSPDQGLLDSIKAEAAAVGGVVGVHDISVHEYGPRRAISIHVEVQGGMDVTAAHGIADEVERRVASLMNAEAVVHIDPPEG